MKMKLILPGERLRGLGDKGIAASMLGVALSSDDAASSDTKYIR